MVAFVPGLSNRVISPGSPAPISFGMGHDPSQSMSLNPGAGNPSVDIFGATLQNSGGVPPGASSGPIPSGWRPDASLSIKDLAPVNVSAQMPASPSSLGSLYNDSGGASGIAPPDVGGVSVTNIAPTNVRAQMPVKPTWLDQAWMWKNDHPVLGNLAQGALGNIPLLGQVMVAANAYEKYKHAQPLFGSLSGLGSAVSGLFSGLGDGPGSPLSNSPNSPLFASLYDARGSGSGADPNAPGGGLFGAPTIASSGALPAYPGLSGLSGGSAPLGGFWNQQALRDAAPVYGPYAAFGHGTPSSLPAGAPFAPAGILGA